MEKFIVRHKHECPRRSAHGGRQAETSVRFHHSTQKTRRPPGGSCQLRLRHPAITPDEMGERVAAMDERLDIGDVPAVEVVLTVALHLMSASAIACGLSEDPTDGAESVGIDLAEARILISALAGLVTAAAPLIGSVHAAPIRDGLTSLQRAFREASAFPDPPGMGPGEDLTGPVY